MPNWSDILHHTEPIAHQIGEGLLGYFGQVTGTEKADGSLVTQADRWADQTLQEAIAHAFPEYGILSEEGEHIFPDQEWCWVIDPLDGTTNFTRGLPLWGISLGLLYRGTPVFGLVYFPCLKHTFHGYWYGDSGLTGPTGAYLNNHPIHVTSDEPTGNHFFNLCARSTGVMKEPFPCKIRMLGVASYNLLTVAAGFAVGGVEATPKIWDIAAVWAIAHAAGATWTPLESDSIFPLVPGKDYSSRPFPTLITSRPDLAERFLPYVEFLSNP
jgi:myo-inositol-1(or 4)-monophosphatase